MTKILTLLVLKIIKFLFNAENKNFVNITIYLPNQLRIRSVDSIKFLSKIISR